jgi:phosphopantothenoylcysteine decarboxylase/phosphopantothenate--cysteine ligase
LFATEFGVLKNEAGAQVTLVHGNISVTLNQKAQIISAMSAKEMYQSVMDNIVGQDIFIACAAVSDYSIKNIAKKQASASAEPILPLE